MNRKLAIYCQKFNSTKIFSQFSKTLRLISNSLKTPFLTVSVNFVGNSTTINFKLTFWTELSILVSIIHKISRATTTAETNKSVELTNFHPVHIFRGNISQQIFLSFTLLTYILIYAISYHLHS